MAGSTFGTNPSADELDFGIIVGQHWHAWDELRDLFTWAEDAGFDSAWAFDHFFSLSDGELGPTLEGWTLIAGLATLTSRVQIGLMVTGNTHRNPAVLQKQAVTVDHLSGGRLILGMGAGWNEREHQAYGIPFPSAGERVDRFGEAMEVIRLLESEQRAAFDGRYYQLVDAPSEPKPVYGHIPLLIGSTGRRMLRHVARYADQWDGPSKLDDFVAVSAQLDARCREIGRDPGAIRRVCTLYQETFGDERVLREQVTAFAAAGARSFLFDLPRGPVAAETRERLAATARELRDRFRLDGFGSR